MFAAAASTRRQQQTLSESPEVNRSVYQRQPLSENPEQLSTNFRAMQLKVKGLRAQDINSERVSESCGEGTQETFGGDGEYYDRKRRAAAKVRLGFESILHI